MDKIDLERLREGPPELRAALTIAEIILDDHRLDPDCDQVVCARHLVRQRLTSLALLDQIASLKERVGELEEGLRPFAEEFKRRTDNPRDSEHRRSWNRRMPGEWNISLQATMADGRRARALLSPSGKQDGEGEKT